MNAAVPVPPATPSAPFRGIEEFRFIDRAILPSRDREIRRLLRLITLYRGVLFYGDSGVGKSSMINAGVIPQAIEEGFAPERIRIDPRRGSEIIVERISLVEGDEPPYLPSRFSQNEKSRRVTLSIGAFEKNIRSLSNRTGDAPYPLLIFDQFEELLTLLEPARGSGKARSLETQEQIITTLLGILGDGTLPVKMLFSFREDFLAKLSKIFCRHPNLNDQFLRLEPMTIDRIPVVVETPFKNADIPRPLPGDVVAELERQFRERSETDLLVLSEVQIAALRLWSSDDPKALLAKRGVAGLIEDYFSEAIQTLGDLHQPAMLLLHRMVTFSDTRNVVSLDDLLGDVSTDENIPRAVLEKALKALEKGRVVRGERRNNIIVYEIVSEYLVPWIARKRAELAAERRQRAWIEEQNREYVREVAEQERRRWKRTVRFYQIGAIVAAALIVGMIIYGQLTSNRALKRRLDTTRSENQALQMQIVQLQKDLQATASLKADLQNLQARYGTVLRTNEELNGSRVELERKLAVAQGEIQRLNGEIQRLLRRMDREALSQLPQPHENEKP